MHILKLLMSVLLIMLGGLSPACRQAARNAALPPAHPLIPSISQLLDPYLLAPPDSLYISSSGYSFGMHLVNGRRYAWHGIDDSILRIYSYINGSWEGTDTCVFQRHANGASVEDLNGDGYQDLLVWSISDAYANQYPAVFLHDASRDAIRHAPAYSLANPLFNAASACIISERHSAAVHPQHKALYAPCGDSVEMLAGVQWIPSGSLSPDSAAVQYFREEQDQRTVIQEIRNQPGLWEQYDTIFAKWFSPL